MALPKSFRTNRKPVEQQKPKQPTVAEALGRTTDQPLTPEQKAGALVEANVAARAWTDKIAAIEAHKEAVAKARKAHEDAVWARVQARATV